MSTLAKFIMAMIAVLFVALATVVILKARTPLEQPAISVTVDPTPLDPAPLEPKVEVTPPEITPPAAGPTNPPTKRKLLPGNRKGLLGGRLRRNQAPPMQ